MPTRIASDQIIEFPDGERHEVLADEPGRLVIEFTKPAGQGANPPHAHDRSDEVVHVLAGRLRFTVGWTVREIGPGDTVRIPRGTRHFWEVLGDDALHARVEFTPGCEFHHFLRDYAAVAGAGGLRRGRPGLCDFALLQRRHIRDMRITTMPAPVLRAVVALGAGLAALTGHRLPAPA